MTLGKYLVLVLTNDPDVAALASARVFTELLPQDPETPAVVFNVVAGDSDQALDGPTSVGMRRVQVDAWATTREKATSLALAVKAALDGHAGAAAGFEVQSLFHLMEWWDFDPETKLYRTSQDFEVWTSGAEM